VTIEGAGFGSKDLAGPVLWDEFEGGALGTPIENQDAVYGTWQTGAGSSNPRYTADVKRVGTQSCLHPFSRSVYNSSLSLNLEFAKAYLDFWVYVDPIDETYPDGLSRNWKPFRLYGDSDQLQSGLTFLNGDTAAIGYFYESRGTRDTQWFTAGWPRREWIHIQYWLELNDPGDSNGSFGVRWSDHSTGDLGELRLTSAPMNQVRIGHYWATDPVPEWDYTNPGANVYNDSVYFDTSWARIEIGDRAVYDECTHREIQIAEEWSDHRVRFEPRRGTLPSGTHFVFVIDEQNVVRTTEPIEL
jgi:hypothetical protein